MKLKGYSLILKKNIRIITHCNDAASGQKIIYILRKQTVEQMDGNTKTYFRDLRETDWNEQEKEDRRGMVNL